jgi:hypothetical protein
MESSSSPRFGPMAMTGTLELKFASQICHGDKTKLKFIVILEFKIFPV